MRRKIVTFIAMVAFIAMVVVPAVQAYNEMDHVYVAPNGIGDALIFPAYLASFKHLFKMNLTKYLFKHREIFLDVSFVSFKIIPTIPAIFS